MGVEAPGERYNSSHTVLRHTARTAGVMVWATIAYDSRYSTTLCNLDMYYKCESLPIQFRKVIESTSEISTVITVNYPGPPAPGNETPKG
ncbi:hypothetical protein TNCV_1491241 [Trichonephila clavipes]|nr:hypothetical protein TNCV_1491241 [Trichonephila clavipes]